MQRRRGRQRIQDISRLGVEDDDMAIRGPRDDLGVVFGVDGGVDVGRVAPILLQRLPGLQAVRASGLVERCGEQQRRVLGPSNRRDPLPVRTLVPPRALARGHPPDLQLAVLAARGEQLGVLREGDGDDGLVVHHEAAGLLVLQVLAQHRGLVVPDLHEAVHGARDAVLPVRREARALGVRLLPEPDGLGDRRGATLPLLLLARGHTAEDVDPGVGGQEAGVLLPLHGLADERQQP
mmetsp:Transcript_100301/g.312532  ORF Transcript_100301/g.312532 Transcript_100301/m.312532 type:complete len:236 (-) Transcript_100301:524-1231(-)